jgi:hypothetical protein
MFGMNREIECLLFFDPSDPNRQRVPLSLLPSRSFREWVRHGVGSLGWVIHLGGRINT